MSGLTKQNEIDLLKAELLEARSYIAEKTNRIEFLEERIEDKDQQIRILHNEIDDLIHTPKFAADTEAAFDRGRHDGVRSLASTANNYIFAMAEETIQSMNNLVNKYTRELASQAFLGAPLEEELVQNLPDTDFAKNLLAGLSKAGVVDCTHTQL